MRLKDNFDFFDEWDRKNMKYINDLPKCDLCGEEMEDWYHIIIEQKEYRICEHCVEYESYEEGDYDV